ncbi:hydroxyethylthiazole kinase [Pengzhenrongella sicca]|uniref:Hydroxyethylthiazole kinase n=1 Tax=Pengzhenrongella sicca TaxID=2819238 RepID=A0A8A4ZBD9_9MICO|nr:hydroxyethylthiazole kinase [Pengzhenrongella sicca]QTE27906.1 hydroxyethylthiazole kinase [Pengzhenrongella sicca]
MPAPSARPDRPDRPNTDLRTSELRADAIGAESISANDVGGVLAALRERAPLVHCLTNVVVAQWTANLLLAVGASPIMVDNPHEAAPMAAAADAVLVNLGTPSDETVAAMLLAVAAATSAATPWVLDPVGAGALSWRTRTAERLLAPTTPDRSAPTILRGNASEILALAGGAGGKGVDATHSPEAALPAAIALAREHGCVVAISGEVDHLTDGERVVRVANGHPLLTRVTGVGCALGALMAACCAVTPDALLAAVTATATLTVAAETAANASAGPGSFAVALLDALAAIEPDGLVDRVRLA